MHVHAGYFFTLPERVASPTRGPPDLRKQAPRYSPLEFKNPTFLQIERHGIRAMNFETV